MPFIELTVFYTLAHCNQVSLWAWGTCSGESSYKSGPCCFWHHLYLCVPRNQELDLVPKPNSWVWIWIWMVYGPLFSPNSNALGKQVIFKFPLNFYLESIVQACFGQREQGCHLFIPSFIQWTVIESLLCARHILGPKDTIGNKSYSYGVYILAGKKGQNQTHKKLQTHM